MSAQANLSTPEDDVNALIQQVGIPGCLLMHAHEPCHVELKVIYIVKVALGSCCACCSHVGMVSKFS
jgi:hypothetical protein